MKSLAKVAWLSLFTLWFGFGEVAESNAYVLREGHRVFIVDRTGENWDVAQAAALGFDPRGFQFGIGRDSIQALHDTDLDDKETGSLWYPYEKGLMGIQEPYFKRWLPVIFSEDTTFGQWIDKHPQNRIAH